MEKNGSGQFPQSARTEVRTVTVFPEKEKRSLKKGITPAISFK